MLQRNGDVKVSSHITGNDADGDFTAFRFVINDIGLFAHHNPNVCQRRKLLEALVSKTETISRYNQTSAVRQNATTKIIPTLD